MKIAGTGALGLGAAACSPGKKNTAPAANVDEGPGEMVMRTNNRNGDKVSLLGYGCMRFTQTGGKIDLEKAEQEVLRAFEMGVNYYDTAYIYPGSEEALGKIIEKHGLRDKITLTTKLPQYMVKNRAGLDKYLDEELKRLRTDHLDYYLMHHMTDYAQWERLAGLGIVEWMKEKKEAGVVKHFGFSFHGNTDMFLKILNAHDWELCLVQYNYMDEFAQAGRAGVEAAAAKGIPVLIMEPLRGGKLVNMLPESAKKIMKDSDSVKQLMAADVTGGNQ